MNTRAIKARHGHHESFLGKLIMELCNEIERLRRNERVRNHTYRQILQLTRPRLKERKAA